ncbi:hypothetical protein [Aliarcobacter butzleri]|uniref:hypothetical protein n=1 Tax=Aliarcobacter butzleri TaxID=28197 RepID=UPI0021B297A5|nr:hypothetical protein [Aliarcobacter butzleri]MCT7572660.1 hypothetical protein [Aliarcobacter butzleri]
MFHTLKIYNDYINFYKILSLSMLSVSFFIIFEFLARNYLNINIDNFVYHMGRESYIAETAEKIIRARGFATESGLMSIYYEFCIFLSYIYIRQKSQLVGIIFYIINLFAFTLLFSSAAFFCLGVSLLIFFILNLKSFLKLLYTLFFPLLIFIFLSYDFISQFIVQVFLNKITLLNGNILSGSSLERYSVYNLIYNIITEFPFGIGLGISQSVVYLGETYLGYEVSAGQLSLYGTLLISGGFISLILFIFFIFNKLYTLKRSNNKILFILAASSIFIHYSIVGDYWLPFLWVYLACLDFEIFRKEKLI